MENIVEPENEVQDDYLVLGTHGSGKTVFFSLLAHQLRDEANRSQGREAFRFLPVRLQNGREVERTSQYVDACVNNIRQQRWPKKTEYYDGGYSFEWIWCEGGIEHVTCFDYHDYPGEAYEAAFGTSVDVNKEMKKIGDDIKARLRKASGVMLVLDSDTLFNGADKKNIEQLMKKMFRLIANENPELRLALIFSKLELFEEYPPNMEDLFRERYADAYSFLPRMRKFFSVWPLGSVEYNNLNP